jgi:hypothetical protein
MAVGTLKSFMTSGIPAYITTSLANVYTPPASTMALEWTYLHLVNVTATSCWFSLYVGATGAGAGGTELFKFYPIAGYGTFDWFPDRRMDSTNFLVAIAQTTTSLTIDVGGYQFVV